jgi:hypothetical protein
MIQTQEQQKQHYRYDKPPVAKFRKKWSKSSGWGKNINFQEL